MRYELRWVWLLLAMVVCGCDLRGGQANWNPDQSPQQIALSVQAATLAVADPGKASPPINKPNNAEEVKITPRPYLYFADYARLYAPKTSIALTGASLDTTALRVHLSFDASDGCVLRYDNKTVPIVDGCANVEFPLEDKPAIFTKPLVVVERDRETVLKLEYYPRSFYASHGMDNPGVFLVHTTLARRSADRADQSGNIEADRSKIRSFLGEESLGKLSAKDRAIHVLRKTTDAIEVYPQEMSHLLQGSRGLWIMEQLAAGKGYIACSGKSIIARDYLRAADIPARLIALRAPKTTADNNVSIYLSEDHTTSEVFIDGKWRWCDPTFKYFYARTEGSDADDWLSLWEVLCLLHDPKQRDNLVFGVYDPQTNQLRELKIRDDKTIQLNVSRYLTSDKTLEFLK